MPLGVPSFGKTVEVRADYILPFWTPSSPGKTPSVLAVNLLPDSKIIRSLRSAG